MPTSRSKPAKVNKSTSFNTDELEAMMDARRKKDDMKEVTYKCSKCGATDGPCRFFPAEIPMAAINCWKCHAGYKVPLEDMLRAHVGMFPVQPVAGTVQ